MIDIAFVRILDNGELKFEINEELMELFNDEQEMFSYIDEDNLNKALIPFVKELIKRVKSAK